MPLNITLCWATRFFIQFLQDFLQDALVWHSNITQTCTQLMGRSECWNIWGQPMMMMILKVSQGNSLFNKHCWGKKFGTSWLLAFLAAHRCSTIYCTSGTNRDSWEMGRLGSLLVLVGNLTSTFSSSGLLSQAVSLVLLCRR